MLRWQCLIINVVPLTFDIKAQVHSLTLTINETAIKLTVNFQCLSDL